MNDFFNPKSHEEILTPMYGTTHLLTIVGMIVLLLLVLWRAKDVRKWVLNDRLLNVFVIVFLVQEVGYWGLIWGYGVEPLWERFPFHLCASMSLFIPVLILARKKGWVRFFAFWSMCAGFISFVNPSFVFYEENTWGFIHYLIRHYFLFLMPIILTIAWDFRFTYRELLLSIVVLFAWACLIFVTDWITGANYMHIGPGNPLEVPFLPKSMTVWPWSFPSFTVVGFMLFHVAFLGLKAVEKSARKLGTG